MSTLTAPVSPVNGTVPSVRRTTRTRKPTAPQETVAQRKAREIQEAKARKIMRVVGIAGTALVWVNALWVSYFHIAQLAILHGQSQSAGHMIPVIIDGLMLVSSVAIVAQRHAKFPKVMFGIGAVATISANVASVPNHDVFGYAIAGFVGTSLVGSAVLLERLCLTR